MLIRHSENKIPNLTCIFFFYNFPVAMVMEYNDCMLSEGVLSEEQSIRGSSLVTHLENRVN